MKDFAYLQPETLTDASKLLENTFEESLPYAGGTDLLGMMKNDLATPEKVVNLKSIPGLTEIKYTPGKGLSIGALVRVAQIASDKTIQQKYTVLAQAAQNVASPQLRNMGTIGGNLCQRPRCWYFRGDFHCLRKGGDMCYAVDGENKYHCIIGGEACYIVHPSDTAVALLALDAQLNIYSNGKTKTVSINDFFILPGDDIMHENILQPGEIVTEIIIPEPKVKVESHYLKFTERGAWDFAIVSVAVIVEKSATQIKSARVAWGGIAPRPWQDPEFNKNLQGVMMDDISLKKVTDTLLGDARPLEQNGYKVILTKNLTRKALLDLV